MRLVHWLDARLYPKFGDDWDSDVFRDSIAMFLHAGTKLLDFGAGRGIIASLRFKGVVAFAAGVDVDPAVLENRHLDEARVLEPPAFLIPYPTNHFDVVFASNVLEHLEHPVRAFEEIRRVLRPGGVFIAKTPSRRHYVATIASLTPHWFHVFVNRLRGQESRDTFPTFYRCNTPQVAHSVARAAGFDVVSVSGVEGRPEYLRMNALFYVAGFAYERIVNATAWLAQFRAVMIVTLRKPALANRGSS